MKHLRKYIRKIIQEAFNTPNPGNIHDRLAFIRIDEAAFGEGAYTFVLFNTEGIQEGIAEAGIVERRLREEEDEDLPHDWALNMILRKGIVGMISVLDPPFKCNDAMMVNFAAAESPLGPTVYDIAAMDPDIPGGIFADRRSVKPRAQMIYQYYFDNRQDDLEEFYAMDDIDNPVTVSDNDDCVMSGLVDPGSTPYVELFFIASLDFLERKYPKEYNAMIENMGGGRSLNSTAHSLGFDYSTYHFEDNIAEYFINTLKKAMRGQISSGLKAEYADWAQEMVNVEGSLDAYLPSASDWFSDRAMNFTYKVEIQPEWTQMKQRGDKIRSDLMKMLTNVTKEFFDESILQRAKEFFNRKY